VIGLNDNLKAKRPPYMSGLLFVLFINTVN